MSRIVHVIRTSSTASTATTLATSATPAATPAPAGAAVSTGPTGDADNRRRRMTEIIAELQGSMRLLHCAATGRLMKQGVSMTQLHVLGIIDEHGELPMSGVAALLDASVSNATGLIDRMVERGLVERVRVPNDRRVVLVRIAPDGRAALEEMQLMRDDFAMTILDRLGDDELEGLRAGMRDLRLAIRAEATANPDVFDARHRHDTDQPPASHPRTAPNRPEQTDR